MPNFRLPTPEEIEKMRKSRYDDYQKTPESMSYWFPKISESKTKNNSVLQLPETKVIPLSYEMRKWLISDHYTDEATKTFENYVLDHIGDFLKGKKLFLKTGIFSCKFFIFNLSMCDEDRKELGVKFREMFYHSMMLGADRTTELVVREFIESKEAVLLYMKVCQLHTRKLI